MRIEGVIEAVLETFPLQVVVRSKGARHTVALLPEAAIETDGGSRGPGDLRPGQRVAVEVDSEGARARRVEILAAAASAPSLAEPDPVQGADAGDEVPEYGPSAPIPRRTDEDPG